MEDESIAMSESQDRDIPIEAETQYREQYNDPLYYD
jgi:hypothetical protein